MKKDLVIDVSSQCVSLAVLEDERLVELHQEPLGASHTVGDIYLGRVTKVEAGMNAAFVDVLYDRKKGFLHYSDLGSNFVEKQKALNHLIKNKHFSTKDFPQYYQDLVKQSNSPLPKDGQIGDYLKSGDWVLVQITKEPIGTKGPRLTTDISISGRNLVLHIFDHKNSASKKLPSDESRRLKKVLSTISSGRYGTIVRSAAKGNTAEALIDEYQRLDEVWQKTLSKARSSNAVSCIYSEPAKVFGLLRDKFDTTFQNIWVNDDPLANEIREYIDSIAQKEERVEVKLHTGPTPIFDARGVTKQIKTSTARIVRAPDTKAYICIDQTEALWVIDVNSGGEVRKSDGQEDTAISVNMLMAAEIVRQIKLRDLGGIIIIDFIDMKSAENKAKIYDYMKELMKSDRARHEVLPLTRFGLMQITRHRVRPAVETAKDETCPACNGTGKLSDASILLTEKIERDLKVLVNTANTTAVHVHVHPFVEAYIKKGFFPLSLRWRWQIARGIRIIPNQSLSLSEYKYYDKDGLEFEEVENPIN